MRKHIAKALKSRSQAVRNALDRYNRAAASLKPPQPRLSWDEVVEYTFVSQFDLLRRACREDISTKPWATPAGHLALDAFFKAERAREEVQRLNIEIPRLMTWMRDLDHSLESAAAFYSSSDPILSHHILLYRLSRCRSHPAQRRWLGSLSLLHRCTASLLTGTALQPLPVLPTQPSPLSGAAQEKAECDESGDEEDNDTEVGPVLEEVISMATDGPS